ncbi:hypothetical protein KJ693_00390 [bacterium]|nr:hypothetical protein [bacterium]MBU1613749.1 hypothetical protein [bacterium]
MNKDETMKSCVHLIPKPIYSEMLCPDGQRHLPAAMEYQCKIKRNNKTGKPICLREKCLECSDYKKKG